MLDLVREGEGHNWWQVRDGNMPAMWQDILTFEKEAAALQNYEQTIVPGLLQTPEYARAITTLANENLTTGEIETLVELRATRQQHWRRPEGPSLHVVIDENVCRRPVGGVEVMHQQLRHIVHVARQSKLAVQVLPANVVHPGLDGPFVVLDFDKDPSLVYTEHRFSGAFLEGSDVVSATKDVFRRLRRLALPAEDSVELIASIADGLR